MKTKTSTPNVSPRFSLRLAPAFALAALIAFCPLPTRANTIALSFAGGFAISAGQPDPPFDVTAGWAFTLSNPVLLTDLGVWDQNGTGLNESHSVTLWTSAGTPVVGAQGTVPSGTGPTLTNGFRYISISPVLLAAGSYTIGAFYRLSSETIAIEASSISTASGVIYGGSRLRGGNGFPSGDSFGFSNSYFGPNFQFTAPPTNGVPDTGTTWILLLLGVTATFGLKFFVRRST
jgi:hypothetical protein